MGRQTDQLYMHVHICMHADTFNVLFGYLCIANSRLNPAGVNSHIRIRWVTFSGKL